MAKDIPGDKKICRDEAVIYKGFLGDEMRRVCDLKWRYKEEKLKDSDSWFFEILTLDEIAAQLKEKYPDEPMFTVYIIGVTGSIYEYNAIFDTWTMIGKTEIIYDLDRKNCL